MSLSAHPPEAGLQGWTRGLKVERGDPPLASGYPVPPTEYRPVKSHQVCYATMGA